jgi:hypothetical protein
MKLAALSLTILLTIPALAQTADPFTDGKDGAKIHTASGFVCPE